MQFDKSVCLLYRGCGLLLLSCTQLLLSVRAQQIFDDDLHHPFFFKPSMVAIRPTHKNSCTRKCSYFPALYIFRLFMSFVGLLREMDVNVLN